MSPRVYAVNKTVNFWSIGLNSGLLYLCRIKYFDNDMLFKFLKFQIFEDSSNTLGFIQYTYTIYHSCWS